MHGIIKVDIAGAICRQTHGYGTVRTVYHCKVVIFRLYRFLFVVEKEVHGSVVAAE